MFSGNIKKLTYTINTVILVMAVLLGVFFHYVGASFLVWFSIPAVLIFVLGYALIVNDHLTAYVRVVYIWLTFYMLVTTVCLGYKFGFHLYSMSMIPIIFYTEYLGYKINKKRVNPYVISAIIIVAYVAATAYSAIVGPIYDCSDTAAAIFLTTNSVTVFAFIIIYTGILIRLVITSEEKLRDAALVDRLTGLYNRHYMMARLEEAASSDASDSLTLAILDIDDFKKINDTYGHNAGDLVLKKIAALMKDVCGDAELSRWGGEEFLLLFKSSGAGESLEKLRQTVQHTVISYEDEKISLTVTVGVARREGDEDPDKWIMRADERLYSGKKSGKNKIVSG